MMRRTKDVLATQLLRECTRHVVISDGDQTRQCGDNDVKHLVVVLDQNVLLQRQQRRPDDERANQQQPEYAETGAAPTKRQRREFTTSRTCWGARRTATRR